MKKDTARKLEKADTTVKKYNFKYLPTIKFTHFYIEL